MTIVEVEPQPRIDTIVRLATGGEARRTEYVGTAWFDGKPVVSGLVLCRPPNMPKGIRTPNFSVSFFIPDSLAHNRAALGSPTLSVSVALRASGDTGAIVDAAATFTDDPSGAPTWLQLHLHGHLRWPAAVDYRIVALTSSDAVR